MDLLAAMRVYVRVVERGSMSAAARDLSIGQPAVSERIDRLESHLGARLLRRNTRTITLTDVGSAFYERSKVVLDAADSALAVTAEDQPLRGTLRIAAPHGVGEIVLPPILCRLRERHPQLKLDLVLNDRIVDPVTEGVDISLRLGDCGIGNFVAVRLGHIRRILVAAPRYLDRIGIPERSNDLVDHPFLRVSGLFNDGRLPLISVDRQTDLAPLNIVLTVSHWRPLYAMLLEGAGIGVLQEPACTEALGDGRLIRLLPNHEVPGFDLHALYPASKSVPPKTRVTLSLLKEHVPEIVQ
ncbi:LysR family transcriptional regulator [Methylobacterium sp. J-072]|uniref:LysR family transcriptional regulator n=1 Tax=Methylobacterium sp. J-072 TaxID=2836651 RepID=UPI001FBBB2A6|nr:LysR family transcriptional regulator [Methylobacterium sp. J-072]MCJ2093364.1 LysR family transcriptional regulator [Methylobacterium sp. J-072]